MRGAIILFQLALILRAQAPAPRFSPFASFAEGFGPAVLHQVDDHGRLTRNGFLNPARPRQTMVLWGTGLPEMANPDSVTVYIAGQAVTPAYAGPSPGQPGLAHLNFVLPDGLPDRCYLPFIVRTGDFESDLLTLSHSSSPAAICRDEFGLSISTLQSLDQGGRISAAVLEFEAATQSHQTWVAQYDAAHLSFLAGQNPRLDALGNLRCDQRNLSFNRFSGLPRPRSQGLFFLPVSVDVRFIRDGCDPPASCPATSFILQTPPGSRQTFGVTGVLPPPRQPSTIGNFTILGPHDALQASWEINSPDPADRLTLLASSSFTLPGSIFSGATTLRELECALPVSQTSFVFPQPEAAGTLTLNRPSLAISIEATRDVIVPLQDDGDSVSVAFLLVRTRSGARLERAGAWY